MVRLIISIANKSEYISFWGFYKPKLKNESKNKTEKFNKD